MGYRFEGKCYPDTQSALDAFVNRFPYMDAGNVYSLVNYRIHSEGSINYTIKYTYVNGDTMSYNYLQFMNCDYQDFNKLEFLPSNDIFFAIGIIISFSIGFLASKYR